MVDFVIESKADFRLPFTLDYEYSHKMTSDHHQIGFIAWLRQPKALVLLALFAVLCSAFSFVIWFDHDSHSQKSGALVEQRVANSAEAFSTISGRFSGRATPAIETFLLLAAQAPISQIALTDKTGAVVIAAIHSGEGKAYLSQEPLQLKAPAEMQKSQQILGNTVQHWYPIESNSGNHYWLAISTAKANDSARSDQALWISLMIAGVAITLSLVIVGRFSANTSTAVKSATQFVEHISSSANTPLTINTGSNEFKELVTALNRLAKAWHHGNKLTAQSMQQLKLHRYALDEHAMVCITDSQGRIQSVNEQFCQVSQYSPEELIGSPITLLNSDYHQRDYFKTLWRDLVIGRVWKGEFCNRKKSGGIFWVAATIVPVKDNTGRPVQYVSIQTDITKYAAHPSERDGQHSSPYFANGTNYK
ncbi:PAS domain-containing protein [Kaarinaea lacus]